MSSYVEQSNLIRILKPERKMKSAVAIRERWVAGKVIGTTVKLPAGNHTGKRAKRRNITSDMVRKNNDRLAERNLTMLIDANFGEGDGHYTLTYAIAPTQKQAAKDRDNFLRRLRYAMQKQGKELKYIAVTEYENKRPHHHIIINSNDMDLIREKWGKGHVYCSMLDETGDYQELAEYLIKETRKTFREPGAVHKKRYSPSANLVKPVIKRQYVDIAELFEAPKPISGYYIPEDRITRYKHPITEIEHLEYTMIAQKDPRKYKVWPKGEVVSSREYYKANYEEEQEALMLDDVWAVLDC